MSKSKRLGYKYSTLHLNDGTHNLADSNFHPVKPSYAGDLKYSVQSSDHNGWLKCDGRSLNRVTYAKLFEVIGTAFGNDDSLTFKLQNVLYSSYLFVVKDLCMCTTNAELLASI